jgi:hypothetical protein
MIRVRRFTTKRVDRSLSTLYTASGPKHDFDELKRKSEKIWRALWTAADLRKAKRKLEGRCDYDQTLTVDQILVVFKVFG